MIAIIGHKGFIGSSLKKHFEKKKISFVVFEGDLLKKSHVEQFFKSYKVDEAIFLAGTYGYDFEKQLEKNVRTLQVFLDVGVNKGLKKIVFPSSGAVYGEPLQKESFEIDPLLPNTLYGLSKLYSEECIQYYAQNFGLSYVILRFPNVYGKGNKKGVIYNFLQDIKKYKKITIAGDGLQKRNFLHVEDACNAIEKALLYKKSDIFNISNTKALSVNDIAHLLGKKYSFRIDHRPEENNLRRLILNIDKARTTLGFEPYHIELDLDL